jgi:hypothetical protein
MGRSKSNTSAKRDLNIAQAELTRAKARFWNELAAAIRMLAATAACALEEKGAPAAREVAAPGEGKQDSQTMDSSILDTVGRALNRYGADLDD